MPDRVVAAGVNQRDCRSRSQTFVPLLLLRSTKQHKLRGPFFCNSFDQLDISLFPPLFELPSASCSGVEADDRTEKVHAKFLQMCLTTREFLIRQLQDIPVRAP